MLRRLVAFLLGYLRIEVAGARMERFLNLALQQGIFLWQIQRNTDSMWASISIAGFRALRPVARGAGCRIRIRGRLGWPFVAMRLRRRPLFSVGLIAAMAFLFWASGHVWIVTIKVTGPQNLDPRAIRAVAADAGLKPGAWKGDLNVNQIQQRIEARMGEVSWAVIRLQGTRAVIEVVEKAAIRPGKPAACINLVAKKNGVIEQVIPFQGEPMVKKGDTVVAGELLVECSLRFWPGGRPAVYPGTPLPPRTGLSRTLVAQAAVKARITYREYQELSLTQQVPVPTGRKSVRWVLKVGAKSILLSGRDGIPFAFHTEHQKTYTLGSWRNWKSPVEMLILTAEEVELRKEQLPLAQLLEQVTQQMTARLRWILGPADELLTPVRAEIIERGIDHVGIRVSAETLEEITVPRDGVAPLPAETVP